MPTSVITKKSLSKIKNNPKQTINKCIPKLSNTIGAHIDIVLTDLPVYKNLRININTKIDFRPFSNNLNEDADKICEYVFIRLFRMLFFIDFLHDFSNTSRTGNNLFRGFKKGKDQNIQKQLIINKYNEVYQRDIIDIKNYIFKKTNIDNIDIILKEQINNINKLNDLDSFLKNITKQKKPESVLKIVALQIIQFLNITEQKSSETNKIGDGNTCSNSLKKIINNIQNNNYLNNNIQIYIDADKGKYQLYPIIMTMCDIVNNIETVADEITINSSILDLYDSAGGNSLSGVLKHLKNNSNSNNINKINEINHKDKFVYIRIRLNKNFNTNCIEITNDDFIYLKFDNRLDDSSPKLIISRFFSVEAEDNEGNLSSKLSDVSESISKLVLTDADSFVLNTYYKTMGDFAQIIYCYHKQINDKNNNTYLFISFDQIASFISALFNAGTLKEDVTDPISPLVYFNRNFSLINNNINNNNNNSWLSWLPSFRFGNIKTSNNKIKTMIILANKYNIKIDKNTYNNLYKLYQLHLIAKNLKIPITKKNNNQRIYKSINELSKEIKLKK